MTLLLGSLVGLLGSAGLLLLGLVWGERLLAVAAAPAGPSRRSWRRPRCWEGACSERPDARHALGGGSAPCDRRLPMVRPSGPPRRVRLEGASLFLPSITNQCLY
jgi:hypothetical protein